MAKTAIFTIVSNNYIAYAKTLMDSVGRSNKSYAQYICIVDDMSQLQVDRSGRDQSYRLISVGEIGIDNLADMAFRYDVMELNTAAKPFMFRWLLETEGFDRAIYLDPDIAVYRPLAAVDALLEEGASAVLTPHLLRPLEDGAKPDDHTIMQSGVFNLGFAAMARTPEALAFIGWWGRRLEFQCYSDVRNNLFTDQRWCDFAPCFIEKLSILRHPGYNVAYWNLGNRAVTRDAAGEIAVEGAPLVFFHYSGLRFEDAKLVSKHQDRLNWSDLGPVQALFTAYRQALMDHGWAESRNLPYAFGQVDGLTLSAPIRSLYRKRYPLHRPRGVLFDADFIIRMCNQPVDPPTRTPGVTITQLMMHIHDSRPDLQAAFNLASASGMRAFARWFEATPGREYGLDPRLSRQALIASGRIVPLADAAPDPIPNAGRSPAYRLWRKARKRLLGLGVP